MLVQDFIPHHTLYAYVSLIHTPSSSFSIVLQVIFLVFTLGHPSQLASYFKAIFLAQAHTQGHLSCLVSYTRSTLLFGLIFLTICLVKAHLYSCSSLLLSLMLYIISLSNLKLKVINLILSRGYHSYLASSVV